MNSSTEILAASDQNKLARVSIETQVEVERFLFKQAEILDEKEWESWLDLFTEEGFYWMPAEEEQTEGDGEPNIFWEDRNLMLMRISLTMILKHFAKDLKFSIAYCQFFQLIYEFFPFICIQIICIQTITKFQCYSGAKVNFIPFKLFLYSI